MKAKPSEPLWALLRGRQINGAKFRRQHPIPPYIADFACIEANLVVEVDGRSHDIAEQAAYDAARTLALANAGWRVLRVRDNDVLTASHTVAAKIAEALNS